MEENIAPLIDINRRITLDQIEDGIQSLINQEEELNRIPQRPLLQQHPSLYDRICHPTDATGFWALALYLSQEKKVLRGGAATTEKWMFRAFVVGQSTAFHERALARRYLDSQDRLFRMRQWRNFNGYVRFKTATVFPFRSQVETVARETEELALEIGSPPEEPAAIQAIVRSHHYRYGQVQHINEDPFRLIATAIVEALNVGLLNQSVQEETPILYEVHREHLL